MARAWAGAMKEAGDHHHAELEEIEEEGGDFYRISAAKHWCAENEHQEFLREFPTSQANLTTTYARILSYTASLSLAILNLFGAYFWRGPGDVLQAKFQNSMMPSHQGVSYSILADYERILKLST